MLLASHSAVSSRAQTAEGAGSQLGRAKVWARSLSWPWLSIRKLRPESTPPGRCGARAPALLKASSTRAPMGGKTGGHSARAFLLAFPLGIWLLMLDHHFAS